MERELTLAELTKDISGNLADSINLLNILEELADGEAKSDTLISIIKKNITSSFRNIETCRQKIYILD